MKKPKIGQKVIVYDRYRFGVPLRGIVVTSSLIGDAVLLQMTESNSKKYPIGCDTIWVSRRQLRKEKP